MNLIVKDFRWIYFFMLVPTFCIYGYGQNPDDYSVIPLCELSLNRTASSLSSNTLTSMFPAYKGFIWDDGDNETLKFRPQGITKIDLSCREYVAVSWYGRAAENYENRGARVSLVDVSDMNEISYRHVLLVDENYNTFNNLHAGGLHYMDGILYVPDTRSGNKRIFSFDLNDIRQVPNSDLGDFYNYRHIVKRTDAFNVPIKPSCISYDWDTEEFIIGSFEMSCETGCVSNSQSTFSWFEGSTVNSSSPYHINFFDRIQGITSLDDCHDANQKIIWTSQSYGRYNPSRLFSVAYNRNPNNIPGQVVDFEALSYSSLELPPGLEDLHLDEDKITLWTLTEFGPNEGVNNDRIVFAFAKDDILPLTTTSCNIWVDYNFGGGNGTFIFPFNTLSEAIDEVEEGGTIYIKESIGNEMIDINVNKNFTIESWKGPSIIGQ